MIDATAIIHPDASLHPDVCVGAYSVIGANVSIESGTVIDSHVVIKGPVKIGSNNTISSFCSLGGDPQDKKYEGESDSILEIGSGNTIREYVSINRGTGDGGGKTVIGDNNWIMAYVHIAHDCIVGSNIIFANNATLAGHVIIDDFAILGGFTGVHQFCRVGSYSFSAISSVIVKDVPPYVLVSGNTAKPSGLNREGLKRHGFDSDTINILRKAYKAVYREGLILKDALNVLAELSTESDKVELMRSFIAASERGIVR
ncbi:MAG: acyl-ACP--UDP-N-acetylglucosamine O-acyltransferase [Proteobacteria bacterium]|nr:acyl-ACP--UDP-N-acetylglucosamine O-acyltransferase [Pseudomonadota bacterium]NOG60825.1 acyl-ACP--UDP-N-acetylglucosamine O-acyltransferase [Pseudomonadota bacterium]